MQAKASNQQARAEETKQEGSSSDKRKAVVLQVRPRSESRARVAVDLHPRRERHFAVCVSCREAMSRFQLVLADAVHLVQDVKDQQPTSLIACCGRKG